MTIGKADEALAKAFRATTYRVMWGEARFDVRIGCRHSDLDGALAENGAKRWAIVTAWNPGSVVRPAEENANALIRLEARAKDLGLVLYPASNHADADQAAWPVEHGLFLCDATREVASALASEFGQLACVVGERNEVAELLWTADQRLG